MNDSRGLAISIRASTILVECLTETEDVVIEVARSAAIKIGTGTASCSVVEVAVEVAVDC